MPGDRQAQMRAALQTLAALSDMTGSSAVRPMSGDWSGCYRLRVGSYRAIFRVIPPEPEAPEGTLEILALVRGATFTSRRKSAALIHWLACCFPAAALF